MDSGLIKYAVDEAYKQLKVLVIAVLLLGVAAGGGIVLVVQYFTKGS